MNFWFPASVLSVLALALAWTYVRRDAPARPYRTFWQRLFAGLLDGMIFWPLGALEEWSSTTESHGLRAIIALATTAPYLVYEVWCHARWGQTLGKWAFGVCLLDVSEEHLRPAQALLRSAVPIALAIAGIAESATRGFSVPTVEDKGALVLSVASAVWLSVELTTMLFNQKRRALHDYIAGTVVVRVVPFSRRAPPPSLDAQRST